MSKASVNSDLKNMESELLRKSEEIIFTDIDELSKYNEKLLSEFVKYLNNKHKNTRDVFCCGSRIQIVKPEEFVKEFNNLIINQIRK